MVFFRYFRWSVFFTFIGLALGGWLGWVYQGSWSGVLSFLFICTVLGVLEISLSFDNAIVNARILRDMTPEWQHRFLTWGILIAVFGMRIIFPLAVVALAAWIDPISAIKMAIWQPHQYATIMQEAHVGIAAFGGTFLMMVGLKYFFDAKKDVHWIKLIEVKAQRLSAFHGIEIGITLIVILIFSALITQEKEHVFLISAIYGLLTFLGVEGIGSFLDAKQANISSLQRAGAGAFIYLEVLDASFSFDGVVGAFALSTNLFIIAIGLGIGAFYVRSMTIMLVERQTLGHYRYLEHGAFWAIIILALIMFLQTLVHIPEVITGFIGVGLILAALISSIRYNRLHKDEALITIDN